MSSHRRRPAYLAFVVHRISGRGRALFLPRHFLAHGRAREGATELDGFLRWAEHPLLQVSEVALVLLLAAHLAGGLRLLALEFLGWTSKQHALIAAAFGFAAAAGLAFALSIVA
ncbi:MAG: succinate dehydrogenase [Geminicoccaceae bacterium]|nr:succinate dehydrogenase [Geminicoccaceae bacterium]